MAGKRRRSAKLGLETEKQISCDVGKPTATTVFKKRKVKREKEDVDTEAATRITLTPASDAAEPKEEESVVLDHFIDDCHVANEMTEEIISAVSSSLLPPLRATEECAATVVSWYHLGQPLLAARVRELFFGRSLMTMMIGNYSASSVGVSLSDEEALSCLFPSVHNGEWFATAWEFIEHCRSIPHKLLCEHAPLIPLVASRNRRKHVSLRCNAKVEAATAASEGIPQLLYNNGVKENEKEEEKEEGVLTSADTDSTQKRYYLWFMWIHTALLRYGRRDWEAWLQLEEKTFNNNNVCLGMVGSVWCCYRVFQAKVAEAVARQLALSSQLMWQTLPEAAFNIVHIVQDVYMRLPRETVPLQGFTPLKERETSCFSSTSLDGLLWMSDDPTSDANRAAALAFAENGTATSSSSVLLLKESEKKMIISIAVHLATVITNMRHTGRCVLHDVVSDDTTDITDPQQLLRAGEASREEEKVMGTVLWLYLSDPARQTPAQ